MSFDHSTILATLSLCELLNTAPHHRVQGEEPALIANLYPGRVLGEIALVDRGARTAGARAAQDLAHKIRITDLNLRQFQLIMAGT